MGYKAIQVTLPTYYSGNDIKALISKQLRIKDFTYQIENKSLDARKKSNIHFLIKLGVFSKELKEEKLENTEILDITHKKREENILIIGNGPAGFFSAFVLQKAGFNTILIDRGTDVSKRAIQINEFEESGVFNPKSNYAFGEGGAGTFSDGKLTSRSKRIGKEKQFIISSYIEAGAPEEIAYLAHPHLGTDNLKIIVKNLRDQYQKIGGKVYFETQLKDIKLKGQTVTTAFTDKETFEADEFIIAPGHSAYETYRMLINKGIPFRTKNFAIGSRAEHHQEIINKAQWGTTKLQGVKAAEYRLTSNADGNHSVYSFCMCPGGLVVPASAYNERNIVNGMSLYNRDGEFANAACVASLNLAELLKKEVSALETLDWMDNLEKKFYDYSKSYKAPFCDIQTFLSGKGESQQRQTTYPLGLEPAPLWELLPKEIVTSMRAGLKDFNKKLNGYENGILLGLESKTSAPIQVIREANGLCEGTKNLYIVGEGSGYAGGIISSAADGIKAAMKIVEKYN